MSVTRRWHACKGGNSIRILHYPWLSTQCHATQDSNTTPKLLETTYMTMTYNLHQDVCIQSTKNDISTVIDVLSSEESGWIQMIGSIYGPEAPTGLEWTGFFQPGPAVAQPFFFFRLDQEWDAFSNEALRWICRRLGSVCGMVGVYGSGIMHGWYLRLDKISDWVGYERRTRQNKIRAWTNPHKRSGNKRHQVLYLVAVGLKVGSIVEIDSTPTARIPTKKTGT